MDKQQRMSYRYIASSGQEQILFKVENDSVILEDTICDENNILIFLISV